MDIGAMITDSATLWERHVFRLARVPQRTREALEFLETVHRLRRFSGMIEISEEQCDER